MNYIISSLIAIAVTFLSIFSAYNYFPIDPIYLLGEEMLGTSITTIAGTDTLKNSRTTINDNFTALNAGKIEISTTSLPLITTLSGLTSAASLATVGTIGTGVWQGTDVGVAYGGTGASTLTAYGVLLGNGTSAVSSVSGLGTSGQFLTSGGAGVAPTWTSSTLDQTQNFTWTGNHYFNTGSSTFNGITALNGFTSAANLLIGSSSMTVYPTASSSIATKGYVDALPRSYLLDSVTTEVTYTDSTSENTLYSFSVPANTLGTSNALRLKMYIGNITQGNGQCRFKLKYGGTIVAENNITETFTNGLGIIEAILVATSTASQLGVFSINVDEGAEDYKTVVRGYSTLDSTGALALAFTSQLYTAGADITVYGATLEVIQK